jgi:hypothetical protein
MSVVVPKVFKSLLCSLYILIDVSVSRAKCSRKKRQLMGWIHKFNYGFGLHMQMATKLLYYKTNIIALTEMNTILNKKHHPFTKVLSSSL